MPAAAPTRRRRAPRRRTGRVLRPVGRWRRIAGRAGHAGHAAAHRAHPLRSGRRARGPRRHQPDPGRPERPGPRRPAAGGRRHRGRPAGRRRDERPPPGRRSLRRRAVVHRRVAPAAALAHARARRAVRGGGSPRRRPSDPGVDTERTAVRRDGQMDGRRPVGLRRGRTARAGRLRGAVPIARRSRSTRDWFNLGTSRATVWSCRGTIAVSSPEPCSSWPGRRRHHLARGTPLRWPWRRRSTPSSTMTTRPPTPHRRLPSPTHPPSDRHRRLPAPVPRRSLPLLAATRELLGRRAARTVAPAPA